MSLTLIRYRTAIQACRNPHFLGAIQRCTSTRSECAEENFNVNFEKTNDPKDWKYVERILPPKTVPPPKELSEYPSGWKPQLSDIKKLPYYIPRSRNHMIPVYLKIDNRGLRRLTYVKHIQGDIWLLEKELVNFLQQDQIRPIRSQVDELNAWICIHGDYVNAIKYYLLKKNL